MVTLLGGTAAANKAELSATGGNLYIGSGGIALGSAGTYTVQFGTALIGASAPWSSSANVTLNSGTTVTLQAADNMGNANNITFSGTCPVQGI
jgi:hypothetical protein